MATGKRSATAVPGEPTNAGMEPAGFVTGFGSGTTGDIRPPVEISDDATTAELVQSVRMLQAQLAATQALVAKQAEPVKTGQPLPRVSLIEAKQQEAEDLANGVIPKPVLTHEGWHVPAMSHAGVDALEREQDRIDKQEQRKVSRAARAAPIKDYDDSAKVTA